MVEVKNTTPGLLEELENLRSRISQTGFRTVHRSRKQLGLELDDWFRAQRELVTLPRIEIADTGEYLEVQAASRLQARRGRGLRRAAERYNQGKTKGRDRYGKQNRPVLRLSLR